MSTLVKSPIAKTKLGGKSERPSSPPHPALGFGDVIVDVVQRASDLLVISPVESSNA